MKKQLSIKFGMFLFLGILLLAACKKEDYIMYDKDFAGIYFEQDSIYYSFGLTPFEIESYSFDIPVHIMGEATSSERTFSVEVLSEKTTAVQGVHYILPNTFTVMADSINGYIPITILRNEMGENDYKIHFKLKENNHFQPVNEQLKETAIHLNNRVERPDWKDWRGNPTWPTQLGVWNPLTYIKFIELFREIEFKSPVTYKKMVDQFGPDLKNVEYGWAYDYDFTLTKFCLFPLYEYFMKDHPEMGIIIPKPKGYVD